MKSFLLTIATFLLAIPIASAEVIHSFDADIQILDADNMTVTETIVYDFEDEWRHGIFRKIPGDIEFISVLNELNKPHPYVTTNTYNGKEAKIGDPNQTITGSHTYRITYNVSNALLFFRDHDELYWNVNGTNWGVPIQSSSATVMFPYTFNPNDPQLRATCYTGYFGENDANCTSSITTQNNQTTFQFQTTQPLTANYYTNQNMSIVAGIPRTFLNKKIQHIPWAERHWGAHEKTFLEKIAPEIPIATVAFLIFLWSFLTWQKKGNDPSPRTPIVAHYQPPGNLSAAEINILRFNSLTPKAITATIFELGIKGILKIHETEKKSLTFFLERYPKKTELTEFQQYIYDTLFRKGDRTEVNLSKLKHKLSGFKSYQKKIITKLIQDGYYETRPINAYKIIFPLLGMAAIVIGFGFLAMAGFLAGSSLFIAGITSIICGLSMTKKSSAGIEITQQIKGFETFLKVTEKERLAFHNPPAKTIKLFEAMLPFATALSVEKKWTQSFQSLIEQTPHANVYSWLNVSDFDVSHLTKTMRSIETTTHTASSSGSSGFSGGFSGGGGGGGGGGSW